MSGPYIREVSQVSADPYEVELAVAATRILQGALVISVEPTADRLFVLMGGDGMSGVGSVTIRPDEEAYLHGIIAIPPGFGLGTLLMRHIIKEATEAGCTEIKLAPDGRDPANSPKPFFVRLGFDDTPDLDGLISLRLPVID